MHLTEKNLDGFIKSLHARLAEELKYGVSVKVLTQNHYSNERVMVIKGDSYITPAVGETIALQIGYCPAIKFHSGTIL